MGSYEGIKRWLAELDLRASKITLGMDVLRCQTPEMVRRETRTCRLAYNSIRQTLLQAALRSGCGPRPLSFTAARQKIAAAWGTILVCHEARGLVLLDVPLRDMAKHPVGGRPDRIEPRAVKRRPKPQRLLMQPREQARAALLAGRAESTAVTSRPAPDTGAIVPPRSAAGVPISFPHPIARRESCARSAQ